MKYNLCSKCGKRCRGKVCRSCITANSKKSDTCYKCGAKTSIKYRRVMCRSCAIKETAEKLRDKTEHPKYIQCVHCGKKIVWKKHYKYTNVKFCSTSCFMLHTHISQKHTKESLTKQIEDFISTRTEYTTVLEVCKKLHVSEKVIYKHKISIKDINEKFNLYLHHKEIKEPKVDPHIDLEARIIEYIKNENTYVPISKILAHFHIDYYSTWVKKFNFDIVELNRRCGFKKSNYSYYEEKCFELLKSEFGESNVVRQKTFDGCIGSKGKLLRFDFFIIDKNALIEVDGDQHYNPKNMFYRDQLRLNDITKNKFAKQNNIPLFRIPTKPSKLFKARLIKTINKIRVLVKESELLGVPKANVTTT